MVASAPPVASKVPSALKAISGKVLRSERRWPRRHNSSRPVSTSHKRAVLSLPHDAKTGSVGENSNFCTKPRCPCIIALRWPLATSQTAISSPVPDANSVAVAIERRITPVSSPRELSSAVARCDIMHDEPSIGRFPTDATSVGTESDHKVSTADRPLECAAAACRSWCPKLE